MTFGKQILLGRILKVQGYEGLLIVRLDKEPGDYLSEMESVFIESEGLLVPFFISELDIASQDLLRIKLDGYESRDKVAEFVGCRIFMTSEREGNSLEPEIGGLTGFTVIGKDKQIIGTIKEIVRNPGQDLLVVESIGRKEILVPFHEDLICDINEDGRIIEIDIPEGLADINE
jgi:16S rRNA processing protein RimM